METLYKSLKYQGNFCTVEKKWCRVGHGPHEKRADRLCLNEKNKIDTYFSSNLVTALAGLNVYDFPHFVCIKYLKN